MNAHLRDDEDTFDTRTRRCQGTSATRAQNPFNTTRTCNKLRPVDWFTGEVR